MNETNQSFDDLYVNNPMYYSQPSDGLIECVNKYNINPCKALDIGCGQGRNAIWLASEGFEVSAFDISPIAINSVREQILKLGFKIDLQCIDMNSYNFGKNKFGLIVILTTLNHINEKDIINSCNKIYEALSVGGILYCVGFTKNDPGYQGKIENASECSGFVKYYFSPGELSNLFPKIKILYYKEYIKEDTSHGPTHIHGKVKLIGEKTC